MSEQVHYLPGAVPHWELSERLRKVRRDRGLTQAGFAEQLGVKESSYEAWETGRNRPSDVIGLAERLERVTGVPRQWFLGWMDGTNGPDGPTSESGRRDSNSQHSAWNQEGSGTALRPLFGAREDVTEEQAA